MEAILKELEKYIPRQYVLMLEMDIEQKGSILMCMTVNEIIKNYNSTEEEEQTVTKLLCALLGLHFGNQHLIPLTKDNVPFYDVIAIGNNSALVGKISPLGKGGDKFICKNGSETLIMITHFIEIPKI